VAWGSDNNAPLDFSCSCSQLQGHIAPDAAKSGLHLVCYCRDCRAAELYFKQPDPAPGPVDLFQTTPDAITITTGAQNLGLFRLSPRGTMRWYATCCDTPLFNTTPNAKLPFAGIRVATLATPERIGPVVAKAFAPRPDGRHKHDGIARMAWGVATRMLATRISGRWRQTPFFNIETGKPVAKPVIPSKQERAALYPGQRRISG